MQFVQFYAVNHLTGVNLPNAAVAVYLAGTSTLATIYNQAGAGISNPTAADSLGLVGLAAPDGMYDIQISSGSYSQPKILGYQIYDLSVISASDRVYPDQFDSLAATGTGHDDQPALQAMMNSADATGKIATLRPGKIYYPRSTITFDPVKVTFESNGSEISFSQKTFTDPATSPELLSDPDFATGTPWFASTNTTYAPAYTGGQLVFNAPPTGTTFVGSISGTTLTVTSVTAGQINATIAGAISGAGISSSPATKITAPISVNPDGTGTYTVNISQTVASTAMQQTQFLEVGQQIIAAVGAIVRITMVIGEIDPLTIGSNTYRSVILSLRKNTGTPNGSISGGGQAGGSYTLSASSGEYAPGATVSFDAVLTDVNPYLRIQSNAAIKINSLSAKVLPNNTCILVRSVSTTRGATSRGIREMKITGRSDQAAWVDGIVFDTQTVALTSRSNWYGLNVGPSFGRGLVFQNRAYLMSFFAPQVTASIACVDTLPGSDDAGENISFFGGNFGGGSVAGSIGIRNTGGFSLHLFGTSIDFSDQWYVGDGGCFFDQCWLEKNPNTSSALPYFVLNTGYCSMRNTRVQTDGSITPTTSTPFYVGARAWLDIEADTPYNIHGTSSAMASGPGRITFKGRGGISKELDVIVKRDANSSLLGAAGLFEDSFLTLNAWVVAASGQQQIDRYTIGSAAAGTFTGTTTRGSPTITGVTSGGYTATGTLITDSGFPVGTTVVTFSSGVMTVSQPRNAAGGAVEIGYQLSSSARTGIRLSTAQARTGVQSLEFYKSGVGSGPFTANIATPIERNRAIGQEWWYKVPLISGSGTTIGIFFQTFFVQLIDLPSSPIPLIATTKQFVSDLPETGIALGTGRDWTRLVSSTNRIDSAAEHDGYSPPWATHFLLSINLASAPNNFLMNIDDMYANLM